MDKPSERALGIDRRITAVKDARAEEVRMAEADGTIWKKPWLRWRYPPGCQDGDYCRGNKTCFWNCCREGEGDE